jgi:hypothetical protein
MARWYVLLRLDFFNTTLTRLLLVVATMVAISHDG